MRFFGVFTVLAACLLLLGAPCANPQATSEIYGLELDVQDITFFPVVITEGRKVARITFRVRNTTDRDSGRFSVSYRVESASYREVFTCKVVVDRVSKGRTEPFTFYASVPVKVKPDEIFLYIIDERPRDDLDTVVSFPAMDAVDVHFEPEARAVEGTVVKVRCVLRNRGSKCKGMTWRIVDSEKRIVGDAVMPLLFPGETYFSKNYTWKAEKPGVHKMLLLLNPDARAPDAQSGLILKVVEYEVLSAPREGGGS